MDVAITQYQVHCDKTRPTPILRLIGVTASISMLRQLQIDNGAPSNIVDDRALYLITHLLLCGFISDFFVKQVSAKDWMTVSD